MESYNTPTSSELGISLSHYIELSVLRSALIGLVAGSVLGMGSALAADEARPTDLVLGDKGAKCTIIEYSSLSCPHCAHFHETVLPDIKKDYIDSGKVRMILRDFPLNKPAFYAEKAARCAGPLKRMGFVGLYFKTQTKWVVGDPAMADEVAKIARQGGMTREDFDQCMGDKTVEQLVFNDLAEGRDKYQVEATPSFVFNGAKAVSPVAGTVEEFKGWIKSNCGL